MEIHWEDLAGDFKDKGKDEVDSHAEMSKNKVKLGEENKKRKGEGVKKVKSSCSRMGKTIFNFRSKHFTSQTSRTASPSLVNPYPRNRRFV